jgi:small redox-active disulfide protein 2
MIIKVLGSGCAKCKQLQAEAERAVADAGADATVEKVEAIDQIVRYGVMVTPALVIDDRVVSSGHVPRSAEIVGWLSG